MPTSKLQSKPQSLSTLNTFALSAKSTAYVAITAAEQLTPELLAGQPYLILGGGSNLLLAEDFNGLVLHNQIKGIERTERNNHYLLRVGAGENWHELVMYCGQQHIGGLENLALIPGLAGAAPVQNIGAYGVDFSDVCDYVDVVDLDNGERRRLDAGECEFGYRCSVFKHQRRYFITHIGLKLHKEWQPRLGYGELNEWAKSLTTAVMPQQIANQICQIRLKKLPDPAVLANAGSFFKNPVIAVDHAERLLERYPDMPCYPAGQGKKLAAGWLIDQCGLKGFAIGDAQVHQRQALVLVNKGHATAGQLLQLAVEIRRQVKATFAVTLEPEVNIVGEQGYLSLDEAVAHMEKKDV